MTDLALRDELMTLLVAGQETCAFFLAVPSHICYLQPVSICESLTRSNLLAGQETCALFLAVPPHICHLQLLYFICGSLTRSKVIAGQVRRRAPSPTRAVTQMPLSADVELCISRLFQASPFYCRERCQAHRSGRTECVPVLRFDSHFLRVKIIHTCFIASGLCTCRQALVYAFSLSKHIYTRTAFGGQCCNWLM